MSVIVVICAWAAPLMVLGLTDFFLWSWGYTTVTSYVRRHKLLGVPIVLWVFAGGVFLAGHFWLGWL